MGEADSDTISIVRGLLLLEEVDAVLTVEDGVVGMRRRGLRAATIPPPIVPDPG